MSVTPELQNDPPLYTIKILLLGESSVGKSSIVNRYTNHTFQSNGLLTIGIEVKKIIKQVRGKKIRLELWDTAGQEKYRTLPSQYYRGIQGILLVYDITNNDSFARIEEWFRKIDENCKIQQLILTLVGNKVDLEDRRQVSQEDAAQFARLHHMRFEETSAKTAVNIEETVEVMMGDIIEKGLTEVKKDKIKLEEQEKGSRKKQNDGCCG